MKYLFVILFFGLNAFADSNCNDIRTLQSNWNNKYSSLIQISDTSFSKNSMAFKIAQAMCVIENVNLQGVNFLTYFKKFVSFAFVDTSKDEGRMAETIPWRNGVRIMPLYFDPDPLWDYKRASVLVHEARHLEVRAKNNPQIEGDHAYCLEGSAKGKMGCDSKFIPNWTYAGAYSYEVMFFKTLYDQTTDPKKKRDIMTWIKYLLDNQFNYVEPSDYKLIVGT